MLKGLSSKTTRSSPTTTAARPFADKQKNQEGGETGEYNYDLTARGLQTDAQGIPRCYEH